MHNRNQPFTSVGETHWETVNVTIAVGKNLKNPVDGPPPTSTFFSLFFHYVLTVFTFQKKKNFEFAVFFSAIQISQNVRFPTFAIPRGQFLLTKRSKLNGAKTPLEVHDLFQFS